MQRIYVHPLPVRIWHWINALGFVALILTGVQIRYMDLFGVLSFRTAVNLHNWIGFVVIANFFVWLLFYLFSDKIRVYHPELSMMKHFRGSLRQMQYYGYGIFRGDPHPHHVSAYHKINPLQSTMYQIIMLLIVPLQFFTGLRLWDLGRFAGAVEFFGGVRVVAERAQGWLEVLDRHILGGNRYLCGDAMTIADYFAASFVALAEIVGSDLAAYPHVRAWLDRMKALKSWAAVNQVIDGYAATLKGQPMVAP